MSNNSSTKPLTDEEKILLTRAKSLHDFYQGAPQPDVDELAARFRHAFNVNVHLKKENEMLRERLDLALKHKLDIEAENKVFKILIEALVGKR